jgi:hypothetical protein
MDRQVVVLPTTPSHSSLNLLDHVHVLLLLPHHPPWSKLADRQYHHPAPLMTLPYVTTYSTILLVDKD